MCKLQWITNFGLYSVCEWFAGVYTINKIHKNTIHSYIDMEIIGETDITLLFYNLANEMLHIFITFYCMFVEVSHEKR